LWINHARPVSCATRSQSTDAINISKQGGTMTDDKQASSKQQAKSWKAIQTQVQTLARKAQQARTEKSSKAR
jgi:hypothetical protein